MVNRIVTFIGRDYRIKLFIISVTIYIIGIILMNIFKGIVFQIIGIAGTVIFLTDVLTVSYYDMTVIESYCNSFKLKKGLSK